MTRSRTTYRLVAAVAGLALAVPAVSAAADTHPRTADWWPSVACATGGFTKITSAWNDDVPPAPVVELEAWIHPCATNADDRNRFAFTLYTDDGYAGRLRPYQPGHDSTNFRGVADYGRYASYGRPRAVCVSYGPSGRAACVELDTVTGGLPVGVPISINDPRVSFRVSQQIETDPTCGTCL